MKAIKASKKAPKKVKRVTSIKDVIEQEHIALYHDDMVIDSENMYALFDLKTDPDCSLRVDLHDGELYLYNGEAYQSVPYAAMPAYLKKGGKGSGKYKHLNENNWQRLTDKARVEEIARYHNPQPVEHVYPRDVSVPDVEAYYIKVFDGTDEKSVYLRDVGAEHWRVFYAKTFGGKLAFEAYECSEYALKDLLLGKERKAKSGKYDFADRLLGMDEVQYLSAFMPDEHERKRKNALALAADDEQRVEVNAYYWKGGKCVACADEEYILGLFSALEEIARCSVLLVCRDEDEEPEESAEPAEAELEQVEEEPEETETEQVEEEPEETETEQVEEEPEEAESEPIEQEPEETESEQVEEEPEETELKQAETEPEKESAQDEMSEGEREADFEEVSTQAETPAPEAEKAAEPPTQEQKHAQKPQKKSKSGIFAFFKKKKDKKTTEEPEAEAAEEEAEPEQVEAEPEEIEPEQAEAEAKEAEFEPVEEEPEEAEFEQAEAEPEETESEQIEAEPEEAEIEQVETEPEETETEQAEAEPEETETEQNEAEPEETETEQAESEPEETEPVQIEAEPEEAEPVQAEAEPEETESEQVEAEPEEAEIKRAEAEPEKPKAPKAEKLPRMRGKKSKAQNKIKTVRFDLPQLISAYTASGKKKAHKKAILDALEQCPLIVPISAENIEDTSLVYISKQANALCGVKIIPYVMLADKQALLPGEENEELRQGVMVKTVLSKNKTCIPVFSDFKSAQQVFGNNEIFGIFTLKNILTHISHNDAVKGIIINPMSLNLKIDKEELMPPASE